MFNYQPSQMLPFSTDQQTRPEARAIRALQAADDLYRRVRLQGQISSLCHRLLGRSNSLLTLEPSSASLRLSDRHYAGIQSVPIQRIRGTENRFWDFDSKFRPLRDHSRQRWVNIARLHWMGETLPPVELIQFGEHYYVRDGHHRVSVALARGQKHIDAFVTYWHAQPETRQSQASIADRPLVSA